MFSQPIQYSTKTGVVKKAILNSPFCHCGHKIPVKEYIFSKVSSAQPKTFSKNNLLHIGIFEGF